MAGQLWPLAMAGQPLHRGPWSPVPVPAERTSGSSPQGTLRVMRPSCSPGIGGAGAETHMNVWALGNCSKCGCVWIWGTPGTYTPPLHQSWKEVPGLENQKAQWGSLGPGHRWPQAPLAQSPLLPRLLLPGPPPKDRCPPGHRSCLLAPSSPGQQCRAFSTWPCPPLRASLPPSHTDFSCAVICQVPDFCAASAPSCPLIRPPCLRKSELLSIACNSECWIRYEAQSWKILLPF